jgi:8-oxo-dGTP pyrophosphatase MutT (NUDIX family)
VVRAGCGLGDRQIRLGEQARVRGDQARRVLANDVRGTWKRTLLVAAVIVHDKATNRVVLLQRSENAKFAQGMWDLPVGKNEPGEAVTETAVRELYEETGLTVK